MDNAVKFSPDGGRITVTVGVGDDGRVVFAVNDKGIGMTPEEQDRAFSDFEQGDGSSTRNFGGLGLGLALVKRVTDALGGTVAVESQPEKGSTILISLPALPIRRR